MGKPKTDDDYGLIFNLNELSFICLVMELGHHDMNKFLSDILNEDDIITILYNQIKALNFLHSANIIHRDIKPANILIDKYSRVMICDFGLARTLPKLAPHEKNFKQLRKNEYNDTLEYENGLDR